MFLYFQMTTPSPGRDKGPPKFVCVICGQGLRRKLHLELHMRGHTGEKPYHCTLCTYSSARKADLKRHAITKHASEISIETLEEWFSQIK